MIEFTTYRAPTWACRTEVPPPGPNTETEAEFQRRVDELLAYRTPWWRDVAFLIGVSGVLCLAASAALWSLT